MVEVVGGEVVVGSVLVLGTVVVVGNGVVGVVCDGDVVVCD